MMRWWFLALVLALHLMTTVTPAQAIANLEAWSPFLVVVGRIIWWMSVAVLLVFWIAAGIIGTWRKHHAQH